MLGVRRENVTSWLLGRSTVHRDNLASITSDGTTERVTRALLKQGRRPKTSSDQTIGDRFLSRLCEDHSSIVRS